MTKIFLAALAVVAITGCSKDNETIDTNGDNRIVFGSSIEATTRAVGDTDTQFKDNDEIGVIGYREDSQKPTTDFSAPFMDKAVFTYGNDKFTSTSADAIWQRGKAHNFYAYYPSNLAINTLTTAAPTATLAVTTGTGIGIDVMHAEQQTAVFNKTVTSAALAFTHSLSKIKFEVKKEDSDTPYSELTTVEFNMANQTGEFNVATGAVANSGGNVVLSKTVAPAQEITTTAVSVLGTEWIVLPSDDISGVKLTINGQQIDATNLTGATTEAGKITTITITVKATGIEMTSTITPWTDDNNEGEVGGPPKPFGSKTAAQAVIGDFSFSDGTFGDGRTTTLNAEQMTACIGIVYWLGDPTTDDNALKRDYSSCTHGLIVALTDVQSTWQSQFVTYGNTVNDWTIVYATDFTQPIISSYGANDPINKIMGYNNTEAILAFNATPDNNGYKVEAVKKVLDCREATPVVPASSSPWFLPSEKELTLLCGLTPPQNGTVFEDGYGTDNRDEMNFQLAKITTGAKQIDSTPYWSSSEINSTKSWLVHFESGTTTTYDKNLTGRVRCVRAF